MQLAVYSLLLHISCVLRYWLCSSSFNHRVFSFAFALFCCFSIKHLSEKEIRILTGLFVQFWLLSVCFWFCFAFSFYSSFVLSLLFGLYFRVPFSINSNDISGLLLCIWFSSCFWFVFHILFSRFQAASSKAWTNWQFLLFFWILVFLSLSLLSTIWFPISSQMFQFHSCWTLFKHRGFIHSLCRIFSEFDMDHFEELIVAFTILTIFPSCLFSVSCSRVFPLHSFALLSRWSFPWFFSSFFLVFVFVPVSLHFSLFCRSQLFIVFSFFFFFFADFAQISLSLSERLHWLSLKAFTVPRSSSFIAVDMLFSVVVVNIVEMLILTPHLHPSSFLFVFLWLFVFIPTCNALRLLMFICAFGLKIASKVLAELSRCK